MRTKLGAFLMLASLASLAACGGGGNGVVASASGASCDQDPYVLDLTVSVWPSLPFAVPVLVGMEQGFFEEEGIEIGDVVSSKGGGTTVRNILNGDIPMGFVAFGSAIEANLAGAPLVVVGPGPEKVPDFLLVASESSNLSSLEDAIEEDASLGYTNPGSATQQALALTLLNAGADPSSLDTRATGGLSEGMTLVRKGGIDAMTVIEPFYSLNSDGLKVLHEFDSNVNAYLQGAWVASPQFAEECGDLIRSFMVARAKSVEWIGNNLDEAAELYAAAAEIPVEVARQTMDRITAGGTRTADYYPNDFDADAIEGVVTGMRAIGTLDEDEGVPYSEFMLQDFLVDSAEPIDVNSLLGSAAAE